MDDFESVSLQQLRIALERVLERLEDAGRKSFRLPNDYYWDISAKERYDLSKDPSEPTLGQLSADWDAIRAVAEGREEPVAYHLVWLAAVLRAIGETTNV